MRWLLRILGIIMLLIGGLWTLQGANIVLGSVMSGNSFWIFVGIAVFIGGAVLSYFGWRRQS